MSQLCVMHACLHAVMLVVMHASRFQRFSVELRWGSEINVNADLEVNKQS